jgi:hypothetical protein
MYQKVERLKQTAQNPIGIIDSKKYSPSSYLPTEKEQAITKLVQDDMYIGG